MSNLTSKIVLVAGGAGEVGEGIVRQFLQEGTAVVVPSRSPAKLAHLAQQLGDLAAKLVPLQGDIGTEAGASALHEQITTQVGSLDHIVVSLGGWWQGQPLTEISLEQWHQLIDNSLTAHFIAAKQFLPALFGTNGSYTLINGGGALHPVPTAGPISASAAGQLMLGKVLAAENSANQVRINNLVLGTPVRTRSRPQGQPGWISADDAGRYCVALAKGNTAGETIVFNNPDQIPTH